VEKKAAPDAPYSALADAMIRKPSKACDIGRTNQQLSLVTGFHKVSECKKPLRTHMLCRSAPEERS
jgi:hypothetical protein